MMHGLQIARPSLSCYACPTPAPFDENAFLKAWDVDIVRAAAAGARLLRSSAVLDEDLAQMARYRVLRLIRDRGITSPRYIRRTIKNAIIDGVRRERGHPDSDARNFCEINDISEAAEAIEDDADHDASERVSAWTATLPDRLAQVFALLYLRRLSQRDAARIMGVSQPRVARLHAEILHRGRRDLTPVAA